MMMKLEQETIRAMVKRMRTIQLRLPTVMVPKRLAHRVAMLKIMPQVRMLLPPPIKKRS